MNHTDGLSAISQIPYAGRMVSARCRNALSVRAKGDPPYRAFMEHPRDFSAAAGFPHPCGVIFTIPARQAPTGSARSRQVTAIWTEGDCRHPIIMFYPRELTAAG